MHVSRAAFGSQQVQRFHGDSGFCGSDLIILRNSQFVSDPIPSPHISRALAATNGTSTLESLKRVKKLQWFHQLGDQDLTKDAYRQEEEFAPPASIAAPQGGNAVQNTPLLQLAQFAGGGEI